ncbi:MAG: tetratricopeptide repeat protein [Nitrospirae bacterium]|nr:MAG: tetratricopeptide repeat protein [Nitrospirota bacterium]
MNRTDRRRQGHHRLSGQTRKAQHVSALLADALVHHQNHRLQQAETLYRQILSIAPDHADAHHLLGLAAYQQGEYPRAIEHIQHALQLNPRKPHFLFNLALALEKEKRWAEALERYRQAIAIHPHYMEAWNNLGNLLREQRRLDEAVEAFTRVLKAQPASADAHNNLGVTLKEKRDSDGAIREYREALRLNPSHAEAHNNLGIALMEQGHIDDALSAFQQAIASRPSYAHAYYHLGLAYLWKEQIEHALACFWRSAELQHNHRKPVSVRSIAKSRVKHDLEQLTYLHLQRGVTEIPPAYRKTLESLAQRIHRTDPSAMTVALDAREREALAPSFNQILHRAPAERISEGALNPHLDVSAIEARYHSSYPEIIYVDHLLTERALTSLRQFCLDSTIWKRDYQNGYLGAFLAEGFACPLLLQIAEELRTRFPGIFRQHRLVQAWAFKYDSELRGLNLHADASAVNVNFWITPDTANLDHERGGLVVWDKEAPDEWDFKMFNDERNQPMIRKFLEEQQAQPVRIPYRQNRAIIFNSNLFHETDTLVFRAGYEDRRINITLLYGYRQKRSLR